MDTGAIAAASTSLSSANVGFTASLKVMDMAQNVMEDAMGELLSTMDTIITGLGQSVDMSV